MIAAMIEMIAMIADFHEHHRPSRKAASIAASVISFSLETFAIHRTPLISPNVKGKNNCLGAFWT